MEMTTIQEIALAFSLTEDHILSIIPESHIWESEYGTYAVLTSEAPNLIKLYVEPELRRLSLVA